MFESQGQAKRYFVEKIAAQAVREGHPLSDNERWMLRFSESDPEFDVDLSRMAAFEAEISDAEYEQKIAGLAKRACASDIKADAGALATYQDAYRVLNEGDHYLLIMLNDGLSGLLRPWWAFWR